MDNSFGQVSKLDLLAVRKGDKTILQDVSFTAPFKIMRPFYEKKDLMTVMLLTASAGIMAGDVQQFHIHVAENARMEFVSQAYEKIHRMEEGCALRETTLELDPHACLYYTPLPVIPFQDSDFRSRLEVRLTDESSEFILTEVLSCGRVAHGERFGYHRFHNRISVYQGDRLVYMDNTRFDPCLMDMEGFGMYEGFTHLANLLICNQARSEAWMDQVRHLLDAREDLEGGVTKTAAGYLAVRILGRSGDSLTKIMEQILELS